MTSPDETDCFGYCRHRMCKLCRVCLRLKFSTCPNDSECGSWETSKIQWVKGPHVLPMDGKKFPRKKRVRDQTPVQKVLFILHEKVKYLLRYRRF